jgi:hypothetical protein
VARRTHAQIVADIRAFNPTEQVGWVNDWDELEDLLAELWKFGRPVDAIPVLIGVFERFPTADGHTLWSVMHGLEGLPWPTLFPQVARSVARKPSIVGTRMLGRMLNAGITDIDGEPIYPMLQAVADNSDLPVEIRERATGFMERHPHLRPPTAVQHDTPTRKRKK